MPVKEIKIAQQDLSHLMQQRITFHDCYQASPINPQHGLVDLYWSIFAYSPKWVQTLLSTRNAIVSKIGLKSATAEQVANIPQIPPAHVKVGDKLGMFTILALSDNELVTGESDKHLDFCISLTKPSPDTLHLTTVVSTHNLMGDIYMALIKPFHKLIARTMIANALKQGRL